jgi:hypothetical protein
MRKPDPSVFCGDNPPYFEAPMADVEKKKPVRYATVLAFKLMDGILGLMKAIGFS